MSKAIKKSQRITKPCSKCDGDGTIPSTGHDEYGVCRIDVKCATCEGHGTVLVDWAQELADELEERYRAQTEIYLLKQAVEKLTARVAALESKNSKGD